jgi:3-isopropylmalate/(R)-2-methylmalate dehydratase small subunit
MVLGNDAVAALAAEAESGKNFALDMAGQTLTDPAGKVWRFEIPAFRREQLLTGADDIALTLRRNTEILAYQARERALRPWTFLAPQRIG